MFNRCAVIRCDTALRLVLSSGQFHTLQTDTTQSKCTINMYLLILILEHLDISNYIKI